MTRMLRLTREQCRVYDSWWPHRLGVVIKRSKSRVVVRWDDGAVWRYDLAHRKFLRNA